MKHLIAGFATIGEFLINTQSMEGVAKNRFVELQRAIESFTAPDRHELIGAVMSDAELARIVQAFPSMSDGFTALEIKTQEALDEYLRADTIVRDRQIDTIELLGLEANEGVRRVLVPPEFGQEEL